MSTVGAVRRSTWAIRSLVLVLPAEPVSATTVAPSRSHDVPGEGAERRLDVVDDDRGHADRAGGQYGRRAGLDGRCRVVVAVDALAGEGDEQAAGRHLRGSR